LKPSSLGQVRNIPHKKYRNDCQPPDGEGEFQVLPVVEEEFVGLWVLVG
jgi:hypothetical protein